MLGVRRVHRRAKNNGGRMEETRKTKYELLERKAIKYADSWYDKETQEERWVELKDDVFRLLKETFEEVKENIKESLEYMCEE